MERLRFCLAILIASIASTQATESIELFPEGRNNLHRHGYVQIIPNAKRYVPEHVCSAKESTLCAFFVSIQVPLYFWRVHVSHSVGW